MVVLEALDRMDTKNLYNNLDSTDGKRQFKESNAHSLQPNEHSTDG